MGRAKTESGSLIRTGLVLQGPGKLDRTVKGSRAQGILGKLPEHGRTPSPCETVRKLDDASRLNYLGIVVTELRDRDDPEERTQILVQNALIGVDERLAPCRRSAFSWREIPSKGRSQAERPEIDLPSKGTPFEAGSLGRVHRHIPANLLVLGLWKYEPKVAMPEDGCEIGHWLLSQDGRQDQPGLPACPCRSHTSQYSRGPQLHNTETCRGSERFTTSPGSSPCCHCPVSV